MLQSGRKLTVLDVAREYGIPSLRETIYRLRKHGYPVKDQWMPCQGDANRPNQFKVYFIESANNPNAGGV
jgi:hypothetical protein